MMNKQLVNNLLKLERAKLRSNGTEVAVRCPFCGDSVKSNNAHLYIGQSKDIYFYDCKRCPNSGVLTPNVLIKLGIENDRILQWLKEYNISLLSSQRVQKIESLDGFDYTLPKIDSKDQFKVNYLKERTEIRFDQISNLNRYKIVLSLYDYMYHNDIPMKNLQIRKQLSDIVDKHFVGFLCMDNRSIIFRNVSADNMNDRYINIKLFPDASKMIYVLNAEIDFLSASPRIGLSEGCFDIINIYNTYFKNNDQDSFFAAVGTKKGFSRGLQKALQLTGYYGATVDIYSDEDMEFIQYKKDLIHYRNGFKFNIYYNSLSSDFGDIRRGVEFKRYTF